MMKRPAAAPVAKWLTKDRKCDVCGRGPFAKPGLLTAHRLGEKCRFEVLEGTGRRTDNIMRTMGCETLPFINFLHSTVHHQTNEVHEGPVEFIPFGRGTTLLTLDVATMHAETLAVCPVSSPLGEQLATLSSSCQLWNDRWVRTLRRVPSPMTTTYENALRGRLLKTIKANKGIVNPAIRGCNSKSIRVKTKAKRSRAVSKFVNGVVALSARADKAADLIRRGDARAGVKAMYGPGFKPKSYCAKFFPILCRLRGISVDRGEDEKGLAEGTQKALSKISGIHARKLTHPRLLALMTLLEIQVRGDWHRGATRASMPLFTATDLKEQLCAWQHGGFGETWTNYSHIMRGACLLAADT